MDETLFFYSLSARFKPWYHSWPYVPESTTINPCLKIVIFYRTSPELPTFLVVSNLKGRCSFPDHISKICFRYDNVCANIRDHNNCRRWSSCFCLYTEEPRLATTPFIRPCTSCLTSHSLSTQTWIFESFYYLVGCVQTSPLPQKKSGEETSVNRRRFEDLFNAATTSLLRPGFYGPTLVASTGYPLYFLISVSTL